MKATVYASGKPMKIHDRVLIRVVGHILDIIDQPTLRRCLEMQSICRSLKKECALTNGYKQKERAALFHK